MATLTVNPLLELAKSILTVEWTHKANKLLVQNKTAFRNKVLSFFKAKIL